VRLRAFCLLTTKGDANGGQNSKQAEKRLRASTIDPRLLEILVCHHKDNLEYDAQKQELISRAARLAYPIRDGIPIMLPTKRAFWKTDARPRRIAPEIKLKRVAALRLVSLGAGGRSK